MKTRAQSSERRGGGARAGSSANLITNAVDVRIDSTLFLFSGLILSRFYILDLLFPLICILLFCFVLFYSSTPSVDDIGSAFSSHPSLAIGPASLFRAQRQQLRYISIDAAAGSPLNRRKGRRSGWDDRAIIADRWPCCWQIYKYGAVQRYDLVAGRNWRRPLRIPDVAVGSRAIPEAKRPLLLTGKEAE